MHMLLLHSKASKSLQDRIIGWHCKLDNATPCLPACPSYHYQGRDEARNQLCCFLSATCRITFRWYRCSRCFFVSGEDAPHRIRSGLRSMTDYPKVLPCTPQAPRRFKLICMLDDNPHESIQRASISERWTPDVPSKYTASQKRLAEKTSPVSSGLNKSVSTTKRSRRPRRRGSLMHAALCKTIGWLA